MNSRILSDDEKKELRELAAKLRVRLSALGVHERGHILHHQPESNGMVVVEADGVGGAKAIYVSDQYPYDGFTQHAEMDFATEREAVDAIDYMATRYFDGDNSHRTVVEFFDELRTEMLEIPKSEA
jgi:hypothetical protein